MSSTTKWRKLAESNEMFPGGKSAQDVLNLTNALRAAADRVDELEAYTDYHGGNCLAIERRRAEAAEARLKVAVEALARIEPFLPDIDYGVAARHSEHCQAAARVLAALAKLKGERDV